MSSVLVAVPNMGHIHIRLAQWLIATLMQPPEGVEEVGFYAPSFKIPHDTARNYCVKKFLETEHTHLLFVDSDVVPPKDGLQKLIAERKDAITGIYHHRRDDKRVAVTYEAVPQPDGKELMQPVGGEVGTIPWGTVIQIDRTGGGFLLIDRKVLETIPAPWFKFQYDADGLMEVGEDVDFCQKLEKAGFTLWAHFGVECDHYKEYRV